MICPNCHSENESGAKFCTHCGANMYAPVEANESKSSYLLFAWAMITVVLGVTNGVITHVTPGWYNSHTLRPIMAIVFMLQDLSQLLVPFAIKKTPLKIVALVFVGLLVIYWLYSNITMLTSPYYDY